MKVGRLIRRHRSDLWMLRGLDRWKEEPLSILLVGRGVEKDYIAKTVFSDSQFEEKQETGAWVWDVGRKAKRYRADMLIVTRADDYAQRFFRSQNDIKIPSWIYGEIEFSSANERMSKSGHVKADLRRLRKHGFEYRVSVDPSELEDFYFNMYLPHVKNVFGETVLLMSLEEMKKKSDKLELIQTTKEGLPLAGQLLVYENEDVRCWSIGVKDGNHDYVKMGAAAALYYFEIQYLSEKGYKKMHVGASRAFMRDGVFQFKRKWGMHITSAVGNKFIVRPLRRSTGAETYLVNNPAITECNGDLIAMIVVDEGEALSESKLLELYKKYFIDGLRRLDVYTFGNQCKHVRIPEEVSGRITLRAGEELFSS